MDNRPRVHVFENALDDWWAECMICKAWVSTSNRTRRDAEQRFGRHFEREHEGRSSDE